jgi:DNA polymerase III subunit delta
MAQGNDLERLLASGKVPSVLALVGSESTLVFEAVTAVRAKVLTRAADFNRTELRAPEAPIERVIEAAGVLPMMAPVRYVHLADVHKVPAKDQAALVAYIEKPSPTTVLVLSGEKLDGRTKLGQVLTKTGALFSFEPPKQHEVAGLVAARARRQSLELEPEAARLLGDLIGAEVGSIDRALEKASLHAGPGAPITAEDIEAVVAPTRVHSIFELTDAIGSRDLGKASLLLRNTLSGGESGLPVLAMITRQFRQLLAVKAARARGVQPRDLASELGIKPFLVDQLLAQARRYEEVELQGALDAALRADIRMKSTRLDAGVVLDRLLVEVMSAPRA